MNRRYTVEKYMEIIDYARAKAPDFSFTTDIIVGFPGETYEQFCRTKELIKRVKYDNIYSFVYSRRSGTPAAKLPDDISDKQKGLWLRELILEQREVTSEWLGRSVGRELVSGDGRKGEGWLTGKSGEDIIVEFKGGRELIGQFAAVRIVKAMNWALEGTIL